MPCVREDEVMSRVRMFALAGATMLVSSGALAADLPAYQAPVQSGGWYLRGYIGQSNQFVNSISHPSFVGAGVGVAFNTIAHFRDTNVIAGGGGWADTGTQTNLAWALHAGASYRASSNFAVELSYRYLNVGNARSGTLQNLDPLFVSGNPLAAMTFHNIQSHDLMLGVRWLLQPEPFYQPSI